ncbi:glycosyltransferase family 4 protein [Devosia sp.]|uniref:glycosyltransferase family 4 protein n=1 Tax=Devosia sp. TaxID=1871048 RepID=UPI001ACF05CA|nr:glycosyltransferase family 4 protein [Devosia sp.]MBN9332133.1 glycosyltransferase family 4 protein [Devosia sp.]
MKVALVGNQAFGLLNFRAALIRRLVEDGHEVIALVPDYTPASRAAVVALGATPIDHNLSRTGMNPLKDLGATWQLRNTLRRLAPDLVLSYTVKPVVYGTLAAWLAGVKRRYALIEGLGHAFIHGETFKQRLLQRSVSSLYRIALSRADQTLFLNKDDEAEFVTRRLVPPGSSRIVGTIGVDLDEWNAAPPVSEPMTFLFIGRLINEKGLAEFVAAAMQVRANFPAARFVIVGDVDSNPSSVSRQQVLQWVSDGLLEWPGHTDVKPWIARSSVFVLPSYREGFPRATQEAMAMARAVITTDVPGCRETVLEGQNGFLVPSHNASALADAMERFLHNPELVSEMGKRSRDIAEAQFDIDMANDRILGAIELTPEPSHAQ